MQCGSSTLNYLRQETWDIWVIIIYLILTLGGAYVWVAFLRPDVNPSALVFVAILNTNIALLCSTHVDKDSTFPALHPVIVIFLDYAVQGLKGLTVGCFVVGFFLLFFDYNNAIPFLPVVVIAASVHGRMFYWLFGLHRYLLDFILKAFSFFPLFAGAICVFELYQISTVYSYFIVTFQFVFVLLLSSFISLRRFEIVNWGR